MRFLPRLVASLSLLCLAGGQMAMAEEPVFDAAQTKGIEEIVRAYLIEHPEVLKEAIAALKIKEDAAKAAQQANALSQYQDQLLADPASPIAGNPMGDVTVVEFFDYKCPYCKKVTPALMELIEADKGVRIVFKEFPILGESSVLAARAALAAAKQDRYLDFHDALMSQRGDFDMAGIQSIAKKLDLDVARLEADMKSEDVDQQIRSNHALARAMAVASTPTFIIGDKIVPGAVSIDDMKAIIADVRSGS